MAPRYKFQDHILCSKHSGPEYRFSGTKSSDYKAMLKDELGDCAVCRMEGKFPPYTEMERELACAVIELIDCQNRYKDGLSDEKWTDGEMASRKSKARENGLKLLRDFGLYPAGRII